MKKFFKKIYSPLTPTLIAAACLTVIAAVSAAVVTLGYADNLVMQAQGVGTLKGAVQFAQSHVTFAKDNSNRTLPNVVQERTSLLLYTPHASDNKIDSMTVVATNGSQQLGTISLSPPQDLPKSDQVNISDKRVEYSTKTWSARLPWYWHKAGLILTLKSNTGLTQTVSGIEFSAPSELVLQHIRIGMLTAAPGPTFLETNPELEENKNKIVGLLKNFNVGIAEIKATIGPTVTLYEIVPEAGIRVAAIKKLQDDIALNLSALGIRIIAPMPGKGTIGIEVPRKNPTMVSMRSVIASQKFQNTDMDLPVVFGKTISNEIFMADLSKMPHLLMAGATGQGKSVGINAILTSLLYKKHPSELKFVMVDPKKVELSLYSKIERHYLAKLPDAEEAIITDTNKVINTLNSLCIEMDTRYDLLKNAFCKNLKEYNKKFTERKLNPENGHRYLPYIVLVVDEFADLIMTAGKEVELPIARLAQLARAVGIHLIVATQRPSVNVITGMIKANFPARAAFRVISSVDSRTILDSPGADQLIGKGDMLYFNGNEILRLQCAFVDTPEVERLAEYIGEQKGYASAFILPEYVSEDSASTVGAFDPNEKDALFEEAARIIVSTQQGSTSMLQRQLKLGYNRAGRIMDQLEAAGIVGGFNGAKAREVMISDLNSLESFLEELRK